MSTAATPQPAAVIGGPALHVSQQQKIVNFLHKAESDFAKVLQVGAQIEPAAAQAAEIGAVAAGHPEIAIAIAQIGSLVGGAGALVASVQKSGGTPQQKIDYATPLVSTLIQQSGFLNGKQIVDAELWTKASGLLADAVAALLQATVPAGTAVDPAPAATLAAKA